MSDGDSNVHDELLFNVLKECKTLPTFLNHIFGFLQRRTDFYHIAKDPKSPIGLPDGLAEALVRNTFYKWRPKNIETELLRDKYIPAAVKEEVVLSTGPEIIHETTSNEIDEKVCKFNQISKPDLETEAHINFTNSESYNGAIVDNYCWSQSIADLDITIKVPEYVIYKDIKVKILPKKISIQTKDEVLLEGELCQKCKHNEALWSLDKRKLQIHLDKCKEIWWDCLVTSEQKLDLSKIDCSRPFEELPEDAQAKIEELGWNQERKRLGLPTSDEMANQRLFRETRDADGSPFTGSFDPGSVVLQ